MQRSPFEDVPESVSNQISEFSEGALVPTEQLQEQMRPVAERYNPQTEGVGFRGQMGAGVDSRAMADAITQRAMRKANIAERQLGLDLQSSAIEMKMKRLQNAAKLTGAEIQENKRAAMNRYIKRQQRKRARAGVLGNVLGMAGAVVGGMAGGPGGAAAGYQIGQGVGQMTGY